MNQRQWLISVVVVAAAAFAGGALAPGLWRVPTVDAQAVAAPDDASALPPIFQKGKVVTFGPQGPELTIVEVRGNWIHAAQHARFGVTSELRDIDPRKLFWVHVPSIDQSWQAVDK